MQRRSLQQLKFPGMLALSFRVAAVLISLATYCQKSRRRRSLSLAAMTIL